MGLVVVRGIRGKPQDQQAGPWTSRQRPASCWDCSSHLSYQREESAHLEQVRLAADAKRLNADLHLSFAYISIGPTDWFFESPQSLPVPACLQWPCLEKKNHDWTSLDRGLRLAHRPGLAETGCSLRNRPLGIAH